MNWRGGRNAGRLLAVIDRLSPGEAPAAFWITAERGFHGDGRSDNALALINLLS